MGINAADANTRQFSSEKLHRSVASTNALAGPRQRSRTVSIECAPGTLHSAAVPFGQDRSHWELVRRSPEALHLHPALARLNLGHSIVDHNQAILLKSDQISEPIRITLHGTIITGFTEWHAAMRQGRDIVDCIEFPLSDDEALESILMHDQRRRIWNSFNRVRIAMELKPYFQAKASANQSAGGKYKGSANLPKAEHVDVREEIGTLAGVSGRTVSNVETILQRAAPVIIQALQTGTLSINRALHWCAVPRWKQIEQFAEHQAEDTANRAIRKAIAQCGNCTVGNADAVLEALRRHEAQEPGSVVMRIGKRRETVILLGKDLLSQTASGSELKKA